MECPFRMKRRALPVLKDILIVSCWVLLFSSGGDHKNHDDRWVLLPGVHGWHQHHPLTTIHSPLSSFRSGRHPRRRRRRSLHFSSSTAFGTGGNTARHSSPSTILSLDSSSRLQAVAHTFPTSSFSSPAISTKEEEETLRELYPPATAIITGRLQVDDTHTLSYQVYGKNKTGEDSAAAPPRLNALFLHGGPGAGCFPNHARFFDLDQHYQVVLVDQRGCGQSTPTACLVHQTLDHLVEDCEKLRQHLELDQWDVVLGGSWGTTVAIAYAQRFPNAIRSVILRGVCTLRPQEVDWLFASDGGAAMQHPQAWKSFAGAVDIDETTTTTTTTIEYPRQVLHEYYRRLVLSRNDTERWNAARAWMKWEFYNSVAYQIPEGTNVTDPDATMQALQSWKMERRPKTSPVAVFRRKQGGSSATYETASGKEISTAQRPAFGLSPDGDGDGDSSMQARFRKGLLSSSLSPLERREPWPYPDIPEGNSSQFPVQAMLTCFYSTNDEYCLNGRNLLDRELFSPGTSIPCIAIQGGSDAICPPDTALDLLEVWPSGTMELRIPIHAGHSMYDPYITHEIIQATDRMANKLRQSWQPEMTTDE